MSQSWTPLFHAQDGKIVVIVPGCEGDCDRGSNPAPVFRTLKRLAEETIARWGAAGLTLPDPPSVAPAAVDPAATRKAMGLSQADFARLLAVNVRTLHKREQHTSRPGGAAMSLLKVAASNPQAVRQALRSA